MTAYYNEIDPYAAQWLRNLIAGCHIAPGVVDERSIEDVEPRELLAYSQCHFFAGLGGWSLALRRAGWPDDRPIWTGSCPCQPFSAAGKGGGFADERHLWPAFHWLIDQCRPPVVAGEQVAGTDGAAWLDLVSTDLEAAGYAVGAVISPAASYGAPHLRHRTYWVADAEHDDRRADVARRRPDRRAADGGGGEFVRLDHDHDQRPQGHAGDGGAAGRPGPARPTAEAGLSDRLADAAGERRLWRGAGEAGNEPGAVERPERLCEAGGTGPVNGGWRDADWLHCRDGKWRPVEPGTFPLAHGAAARVGRLRAYGNAIVIPQAQAFIEVYLDLSL